MPVSGIVVSCVPQRAWDIEQRLAEMAGVESHGVVAEGKIVAVVEAPSVEAEVRLVNVIIGLDGVEDVQLAYHNFEDVRVELR